MILSNTISQLEEVLSYETLWALEKGSLKSIAERFQKANMFPSQLLEMSHTDEAEEIRQQVVDYINKTKNYSISIEGTFQYPKKLLEAKYPIRLFYYKGDIGLLESPCISVVGSRKVSEEGKARARKMVKGLIKHDYTVISGLAKGVDTEAMTTAINSGGRTIGVIGTPINEYYPKENKELQDEVAKNHLLISHVPFFWYAQQAFQSKKNYFPQRNAIMSALSEATIIIEASDTSGTLTQARACIEQGRKLFILNSCFENPKITWPAKYLDKGAIRVYEFEDVLENLKNG